MTPLFFFYSKNLWPPSIFMTPIPKKMIAPNNSPKKLTLLKKKKKLGPLSPTNPASLNRVKPIVQRTAMITTCQKLLTKSKLPGFSRFEFCSNPYYFWKTKKLTQLQVTAIITTRASPPPPKKTLPGTPTTHQTKITPKTKLIQAPPHPQSLNHVQPSTSEKKNQRNSCSQLQW